MAYLGTNELLNILPQCIDKFDKNRIDNVAYELSLGDEAYLTDSKTGKKDKLDDKVSQVVIKPGQFALLLTEETVKIPNDILAFISIKFSQKIKGLLNVSGFHVDPGFEGQLIFSVYNAGPTKITLDKGSPYFMMWFSKLTSQSIPYDGKHNKQDAITAENINNLSGELASPNILLKRIKRNETKMASISVIASIIITIGIGLSLKSIFDTSKFNEGYEIGVRENNMKADIENVINNSNLDSIILYKIDNALKKRIQDDTTKK